MIVSCSKCDSKYSVDDSKVDGKRFGFVCPKCGENVEIDNRAGEKAPEQLEEQLNENIFDESADLATGEEDSGIGIDLPEDLDEDFIAGAEEDITGIETETGDILKEVDELGALGTDIDDDTDLDIQDDDSGSDQEEEETGLSIDDFEGIPEPDSETGSEYESDEIPGGTEEDEDEDDDSMAFDEMELPDLENLADISETGVTADDAINISGRESHVRESADREEDTSLSPDEPLIKDDELIEDFNIDESGIDEGSDDFDEIGMSIDGPEEPEKFESDEEKDSGFLDDFSPIEEDIEGISIEDTADETASGEAEEEEIELNVEDMLGMEDVESGEIFSGEEDSGSDTEEEEEDEDITIDLDSLDIQLEEDDEEAGVPVDMELEELPDSDESLIADSLDIEDLESDVIEDELSGFSGEPEDAGFEEKAFAEEVGAAAEGEDEDITLDLDSLDLTLDEVEELKEGEEVGDEERVSLSDAGLTPDELIEAKETAAMEKSGEDTGDEDIRISVDEVVPDVDIDAKADEIDRIMEDIEFADIDHDELPEIDFDEFDKQDAGVETLDIEPLPEDYQPVAAGSGRDFSDHEQELSSLDIDIRDTVPGGMINFSIDYSFSFSRLGAFFRLICLYPVILIPHFIVLLIYSVLSTLLSVFNYLIILFSGVHEEDFTSIQENTIRYFLSLAACAADIVEEVPKFAGRKDIDYPFQLDATYPVTRSRVLAFLRLTVAGILIAAFPHLILLLILSAGSILIYLIGLISIIFTRKWPKALFDFMTRYYKYWANVLSFITGVIDRYPSFKFD
ncbi:MAG: zinc-ribbon domain-containing protein [Spirochaetes bacterium]|nr:zinc-ribbon domain-containing protein [Spirochaetota bacterium]